MAKKKHNVRAINPGKRPKQNPRKEGSAKVTPWKKDKKGQSLVNYDAEVKITLATVPGRKDRWYLPISYVGERGKAEGEGTQGFVGRNADMVRDEGHALAWDDKEEAKEVAEVAMKKLAAMAENPSNYMSKRDFEAYFKEELIPLIVEQEGVGADKPLRREAWNDTVDAYIKDGTLPESAADWSHPKWLESYGARKGRSQRAKKAKSADAVGGPGYTEKSSRERQAILSACVDEYGYPNCKKSLEVFLLGSKGKKRKALGGDLRWLVSTYGGKKKSQSNPRGESTRAIKNRVLDW